MSMPPKITGPDRITFICNQRNDFVITGERFSAEVTVKLKETDLSIEHDPERKYRSEDGGTRIPVYTKPHGSGCGDDHPSGNLTITVTNDNGQTADKNAATTYTA
jgi:hypothetical protein